MNQSDKSTPKRARNQRNRKKSPRPSENAQTTNASRHSPFGSPRRPQRANKSDEPRLASGSPKSGVRRGKATPKSGSPISHSGAKGAKNRNINKVTMQNKDEVSVKDGEIDANEGNASFVKGKMENEAMITKGDTDLHIGDAEGRNTSEVTMQNEVKVPAKDGEIDAYEGNTDKVETEATKTKNETQLLTKSTGEPSMEDQAMNGPTNPNNGGFYLPLGEKDPAQEYKTDPKKVNNTDSTFCPFLSSDSTTSVSPLIAYQLLHPKLSELESMPEDQKAPAAGVAPSELSRQYLVNMMTHNTAVVERRLARIEENQIYMMWKIQSLVDIACLLSLNEYFRQLG